MSVLRRKMFNRGGYAHRGTGITSGLVPVQRFDDGGEVRDRYEEYLKIMEEIKTPSEPFDRFQANVPALLALSSGLMSGKSLQGGWGGAFDILGQSLGASTPLFAEAIKQKEAHAQQEVAAEDAMKMQALTMAYDEIAASQKATQDYQSKDYMVTFNEKAGDELKDTSGMVTRIFNKKTSEYEYQLPSGEVIAGDAFKIDSDKIEPPGAGTKKRTPTTDVAYVFNKGWESGDSLDKKYTQIQTKIDEDNNITLYDEKSKTYVSEEAFREQYGNFTLDQPMDFVAADIAKEAAIDDRTSAFSFRWGQISGGELGELTNEEMNYLLTSLPEDYVKTLQTGTVSELDDLLYEIKKRRQAKKNETLEKAKETTSVVETEEGPQEVTKDAIDLYYNLDPASPNYSSRRAYFVQKYNQTPVMSEQEADEIHNAIANLKDLNTIWDNVEEAIPLIGKPAAFFAETFGVNIGLVEFMTGVRGLEASAIDQLVKGIPSDFDARRVIAMIPKPGIAPETNKIRIKRLRDVFGDLILNKIKFAIETGKRVPASLVMTAMELGNPAEVTEALRGEPNQEKMDYLNNIGAGIEGFTKEGYIKEFGDPFRRSLSLLDVADEDYDGPMSKEDEEKLKDFQEKFQTGN